MVTREIARETERMSKKVRGLKKHEKGGREKEIEKVSICMLKEDFFAQNVN